MPTSTAPIIALSSLAGNPATSLNPFQLLLAPYVNELTAFWLSLWCITAIVLAVRVIREYMRGRAD